MALTTQIGNTMLDEPFTPDVRLPPGYRPNPEDPITTARQRMQDQAELRKQKDEEARELHQMEMEERSKVKSEQLAALLKEVSKSDAIRIRLAAAQLLYSGLTSTYGNEKQVQLDDKALELARYAILGMV